MKNLIMNINKKTSERVREQKAITLIALVITIIILLILASVGIAMLTGENGLMKKATEAKKETEINEYIEKIGLIRTELKTKNKDNDYKDPTIEELKDFIQEKNEKWVKNLEIDQEVLKLTTKEGYIFHVTGTTIEYISEGDAGNDEITAEMVSFTPEDENWDVDNVKDALDDLFNS